MRLWTKIGATVVGILVLGAAGTGYTVSKESFATKVHVASTSLVAKKTSSKKEKRQSLQSSSSSVKSQTIESQVTGATVESSQTPVSTSSSVVSIAQAPASLAESQVTSPVVESSKQVVTSQPQATSSQVQTDVQVPTPTTKVASSSQVEINYVAQAIKRTASQSGIAKEMLSATMDGNLIQVRENHTKMANAGMNVDPSVDPVIANYMISDGQLIAQ